VIPANVWAHVAAVYSSINDVRLFINGQFSTSSSNTGTLRIQDISTPEYITSGNIGSMGPSAWISCESSSIPISSESFSGSIDQFFFERNLKKYERKWHLPSPYF